MLASVLDSWLWLLWGRLGPDYTTAAADKVCLPLVCCSECLATSGLEALGRGAPLSTMLDAFTVLTRLLGCLAVR